MAKSNRSKKKFLRQILDKEGKELVCEINDDKKVVTYHMRGFQALFIPRVIFKGFTDIPTGLYVNKSGWGFGKGFNFVNVLANQFSRRKLVELVVTKDKKSIRDGKHKVTVELPFEAVRRLILRLRSINSQRSDEEREAVAAFLSAEFPRKINISTEDFDAYSPGSINELLNRKGINKNLNEDDLASLFDFFPKLFDAAVRGRKGIIRDYKIRLAQEGKKVTEKIYLDQVISEFETKLKRKSGDEEDWQKFLKEKVFAFMADYVDLIDKQNISVQEKYPDFVLIDLYGFVDVFEIKTHRTQLLSYDNDHDNYYWHSNISKAVSQVENYLDELNANSEQYVRKIKKKKGIGIKVLRPKGFVVAGTRDQFKDSVRGEDFRRLSKSLKNIEFILYDELLDNLKSVRAKIEGPSRSKSGRGKKRATYK